MGSGMSPASALRWTTAALAAAAVYVCWPLWPALVLAAWTAALMRPLLGRFERGLNGRSRAAAALTVLLLIVVVLPIALMLLGVVAGIQELAEAVAQSPSAKSALESIAAGSGAADSALPSLPTSLAAAIELVERHGAKGLAVLKYLAGAASSGVIGLFVYLGGAYVFLVDGPRIWKWLQLNSPLVPTHLDRLRAAFQETGRGLLIGIGLTSATQGVVATLVYLGLGIPRWWVLGALTGLAAILPLVGSALVWGPITIGLFLTGNSGKALILAAIGIGVIGTVDNFLRPVFSKFGSLRMPMFLLFVSLFGGVAAFGAWGVILGPLIVRLLLEAVDLRRESLEPPSATPGAAAGAAPNAPPAP
jgi:predicted PurR-regulated permease PerM